MNKTIASALAAVSLVGLAILVKVTSSDDSPSIFEPVAHPSNGEAAAIAAEKTAALKELFNSKAYQDALPSAQGMMIERVKDLYK